MRYEEISPHEKLKAYVHSYFRLEVSKIARISGVLFEASISQAPNWIELAYDHTYSDQSHLIRECKYFTGRSPTLYLKDRSSPSGGPMCVVEDI